MIISAIDIGTNTILMLTGEVGSDNVVRVIRDDHTIARLGEGVDERRRITDGTMERVMNVLSEYLKISKAAGAERVVACGTSALRDAANRREFLEKVNKRLGLEIEVLSGDAEAKLTFHGAMSGIMGLEEDTVFAVLDIGGGSTEIVVGTRSRISGHGSADVGSVRLTERWLHDYPPTAGAIESARREIEEHLSSMLRSRKIDRWVGVAGTLTTCAAIDLKLKEYDPAQVDGFRLTRKAVESILNDLSMMSLDALLKHPQIHPKRADIITAGVLILLEAMRMAEVKEISVSDRGLRYGLLMRA